MGSARTRQTTFRAVMVAAEERPINTCAPVADYPVNPCATVEERPFRAAISVKIDRALAPVV